MHLINRQLDIDGLVEVSRQVPILLQAMISADSRAEEIGRVLTSITDTLTRRLIELAIDQLGTAPMAFCWLAFGSQARQDQSGCSDQDNGLLLARTASNDEVQYFAQLADQVCQGLARCGYPLCSGNVMATNPDLALSLADWLAQFARWVRTPEPQALLNVSIYFDMRAVYGELPLYHQLQQTVVKQAQKSDLFLAAMSRNALQNTTPLGFFRRWVLERDGREVKGIDLKRKGIRLINDIVRIYALAAGVREVNTPKRIKALMELNMITRADALNLADALELLCYLRLSSQGRSISSVNY